MPSEVILPRVDMDMATGKISKWFVESGSKVSKGQPLFEIETDKAAMEIEAPSSGIIRDLAQASGDDIPVGSVVAWIDAEGEAPSEGSKPRPPVSRSAPPQAEAGAPARADLALSRPAAPPLAGKSRATPLARRLARLDGIDLAGLEGSGPRGRVIASDVTARGRHAAEGRATPSAPAPAPLPAPVARSEALARDPAPRAAPVEAPPVPGLPGIVTLREGTGTPIVLIHGFGADAGSWRPFISGQRFGRPILALDLPGHGSSSLGPLVSFTGMVEAVEAALVAADLRDLDLVGHSLGGAVAASLAARASLDVRSLLLLSPAGLGPAINGDFLRGFLGASSAASLAPWLRELVADPEMVTPAFVSTTLKARAAASGGIVEQRRVAEALFPDDTQSFSVRQDLARVAIPTRVVFGAADRIIPAAQAKGLPGLIATHLFPGVGHMPHMEARDAVATILLQTIAR